MASTSVTGSPSTPLPAPLPVEGVRLLRTRLLEWYDATGQDFPWRTARNPYFALVAAVCAQQTQMSRVLPTFERWIAAFPTLEAAAAASNAEALRTWARAGYPRRALAIRDAARLCLEQHGGTLPADTTALLALPGVGPFTAAIVRCFGFGLDAVAIDTNVVRLLGRLLGGDLQPARESSPRDIERWAHELLPPGEAARWNPALMDYGGLVCAARPRCDVCVVVDACVARPRFAAGEQAVPVRAQGAFANSDREWRGRLLHELRTAARPIRVGALLEAVGASTADTPRVRALLKALCVEGMAWSRGGWCGLGER
ncbi:MAG: A/G-specific adenine glycosylase [Dehalococcoidia bacterium]|nr:A/G-specific adenine glycosylase [Dehalococcoidia bacterium]